MIEISKQFRFEASHALPKHPGKCARLHGHSWLLEVAVQGPIDPTTGFVMDFGNLKDLVHRSVIDRVDHQHLGVGNAFIDNGEQGLATQYPAILGRDFYPSSENLVNLFAEMLAPKFRIVGVELTRVKLFETCTSAAEWRPTA